MKPDSVCLRCSAYYENNHFFIKDLNNKNERLAVFRGQICQGRVDKSGCVDGPYQEKLIVSSASGS